MKELDKIKVSDIFEKCLGEIPSRSVKFKINGEDYYQRRASLYEEIISFIETLLSEKDKEIEKLQKNNENSYFEINFQTLTKENKELKQQIEELKKENSQALARELLGMVDKHFFKQTHIKDNPKLRTAPYGWEYPYWYSECFKEQPKMRTNVYARILSREHMKEVYDAAKKGNVDMLYFCNPHDAEYNFKNKQYYVVLFKQGDNRHTISYEKLDFILNNVKNPTEISNYDFIDNLKRPKE